MTKYGGVKSLDAEVCIDFTSNDIVMDYSSNKYANRHNSNTSGVLLPYNKNFTYYLETFKNILMVIPAYALIIIPLAHMSTLVEKGLVTNKKYQYMYQNYLKWLRMNFTGYGEQSSHGDLQGKILKFRIPNNIYMEYELEGDYKDKISKISLKRHWVTFYKYGKFKSITQNGWDVIFEFNSIPTHGSCILKSTA